MKKFFLLLCLLALVSCGTSRSIQHPKLIGRDPSWFPLQLGNQAIKLTAFSNALIQEINRTEHSALQLANIEWIQLFQFLEEGQLGGIFTSLSPTAITLDKYSFSEPLLHLGPVLIVRSDSEVKDLMDLKEQTVAVYQFDESVMAAQENPSIVIQLYENMPMILEDLVEKKIDAVLMPSLDARSLVFSLYSKQLKIATGPLSNKAIRLITLKDQNKPLIRQFNRGLRESIEKSSYTKLRKEFSLD